MAEIIDIYNANLEPEGTSERKQAHLDGRWHQTFHLWLASRSKQGSLMFQLRAPHVVNYPSMLDITAAGHLMSGETVEEGLREVKEELGIELSVDDVHSLGYRVEVADQDNGQRNREYQAVFLAVTELSPSEFRPDPKEVYGLISISVSECLALFTGKAETAKADGIAYGGEEKGWEGISRHVCMSDFIPRIQRYYLTMSIMAERLLQGKFPISIS